MSKHTPGPWIWDDGDRWVREDRTGATIARVADDDGHVDPTAREAMPLDANARLIAAAPDLLAACKITEYHVSGLAETTSGNELLTTLRAAIASAEGGEP